MALTTCPYCLALLAKLGDPHDCRPLPSMEPEEGPQFGGDNCRSWVGGGVGLWGI